MAPSFLREYTQGKTHHRNSFVMMGKSQKFSGGLSSSFVPDYRHAAETVGESEGLGSSCHADSEYSCTPKRHCVGLSKDRGDAFTVPLKVFATSKMNASEKKELEFKLRDELEQVRSLQKKLKLRSTASISGVNLSSRNCQEKKSGSSNAAQLKRGISGRFASTKQRHQPSQSTTNDSLKAVMKQCESILSKLMKHTFGWVFNSPVDAVALKIPDYYTVIKHPMDLGTIKKRISSGGYSSPWGFVADVRLTFTNAMTYNPPGNDVHIMADKMSKFFESKWKPIEKKLAVADSSVQREMEPAKPVLQSRKRKDPPLNHHSVMEEEEKEKEKVKPKVSPAVKVEISDHLASMLDDMPDTIVDFLRMHNKVVNEAGEEEIEVDIDALSDDRLLELKGLLDNYLPETQTRQQQVKAEPPAVEILSEPGASISSIHPSKGNEPVADEDVDIGGNDPPISTYPPVEIEKDPAPKSSKCSSSSSSSSDSSSSSSDSDSGSSSGSESDDRGGSPAKTAEVSGRPHTVQDEDTRDIVNPLDMNRSLSGLDKEEHDAQPKPVCVEADDLQEGENAPSERQVSPDKLYRAALMRNRFADTILKAREKTLDQGEKGDPERLQREREELERQQGEEKARIQAEAKVAEAAHRRAESEAAAESKRMRERERAAARQALLKMEKTVEINENCLILKDLEMLRSVPGECEPNSVDETSPGQSLDGMVGGFKLGGSNPLEQLGLFMKEDDEEEDEAEPRSIHANDVEEGEID